MLLSPAPSPVPVGSKRLEFFWCDGYPHHIKSKLSYKIINLTVWELMFHFQIKTFETELNRITLFQGKFRENVFPFLYVSYFATNYR